MSLSQEERLRLVVAALQDKKAADIVVMDLRPLTDTVDYFVICSATSDQHVGTLTDEVARRLRDAGDRPWHVEGYEARRWVLIDCVDIVVHLFRHEVREFYALERLWGDAPRTRHLSDGEAETMTTAEVTAAAGEMVFARP